MLGNGGHAKVVAEAYGKPCEFLVEDPPVEGEIFIGIGDNLKRLDLCIKYFTKLQKVIHPTAFVSPSAKIEPGVFIAAHAVVGTNAVIGMGAIINTGATVDHDCVIHSCVHISPGVHLGGNVTVKACSWIGIGASVKHGIKIGNKVMVGAGAAVVNDLPDGVTVMGVPAK